MLTTVLFLLFYLAIAAGVASLARWLERPFELRAFFLFLILPVVFVLPGFFSDRTIFPVDHAMGITPWSAFARHPPRNANLNDAATQFAPWAKAARMAWREGALPLRNRWNGCGMALATSGLSGAFSPFFLAATALPLARAFNLLAAWKLLLAPTGAWLWLRELKISRSSAAFGATAFALSFAFTPWLLLPPPAVISLWPWALFLLELVNEARLRLRAFGTLVGILVLALLAGHSESVALGTVFAGLWFGGRWLLRDLPDPKRLVKLSALAAAIAIGLTAFFLIPHLFTIRDSNRAVEAAGPFWGPVLSWLPHAPAWRNGLLTALFPRALGDAIGSPMIAGGVGSFPEMGLGYFGITGWACALLLFRPGSARRRAGWALLAPLLFGFGAAIGAWPFAEIAGSIPLIRMVFPLRLFALVPLAGAAIAAFELDRLERDLILQRSRWPALYPAGIAAALSILALWTFSRFEPLHAAAGGLVSQKHALAVSLAALGAFGGLTVLSAWKRHPRAAAALPLLLTMTGGAELLYQGLRLYRYGSPADFYPETGLIQFLGQRSGPFRVVGEASVLFPNSNVFAGLEDVRTHDPTERRDYAEFLDATCGYTPSDYFKHIGDVNAPALDFLNVRYLLADHGRPSPGEKWKVVYSGRDGTVLENSRVLPRVLVPNRICVVPEKKAGTHPLRNAFFAFGEASRQIARLRDWREQAYLLGPEAAEHANGGAEVSHYRETVNAASFQSRVKQTRPAAFAVVSLAQDGGWSARDERKRPLPLTYANGPFLALALPPGDHVVHLTYSPPGFRTGVILSAATLFGILLLPLFALAKRRWHDRTSRRASA